MKPHPRNPNILLDAWGRVVPYIRGCPVVYVTGRGAHWGAGLVEEYLAQCVGGPAEYRIVDHYVNYDFDAYRDYGQAN